MSDPSSGSVDQWTAILVLVLFFVSNFFIIFPISIPIPQHVARILVVVLIKAGVLSSTFIPQRWHLRLNFITVPSLSVLVLLACRAIDGAVLRRGIVGANGVEPLSIMALFISLAYISISLDLTGLFRYAAFWVARKGGSSGRRLHLYMFAFFLGCGILVGNDPVVLFGTPFLAYFTSITRISPPTAWIFAQFTAANMASVVLVSANLTNLVLAGAYSLSFIKYTAHVILPFLAGAVSVYPVFMFLFRSSTLIPPTLEIDLSEQESGSHTLSDKKGAIFGSALLLVTLAVLVGTSTIGVAVWQVTVPPAVIMLVRDTYHDWRHPRPIPPLRTEDAMSHLPPLVDLPPPDSEAHTPGINVSRTSTPVMQVEVIASEPKIGHESEKTARSASQTLQETESANSAILTTSFSLQDELARLVGRIEARFPTVSTIIQRLPIPLLPFSFLMFILVQGLSTKGWVEVWAGWWNVWVERTGTVGAVGGMGFVSCVLCNICGTNIGATILLARVLQVWTANHAVDKRTSEGAIYALALGSNYGAFTLTFSASLAGLLWKQILTQKGIHVRPRQFLLLNLPVSFVAMLCSSAVLVGQVYVIDRNQA